MNPNIEITQDVAAKVLSVIDVGLVIGGGKPEPGNMCVEEAVCHALGLPHSDDPPCVSRVVRLFGIKLNDQNWSSSAARAKGLRRLGIAQLGSRDVIDDKQFAMHVAELVIRKYLPMALRAISTIHGILNHDALMNVATKCEVEGTMQSAREAHKVSYSAYDAYNSDSIHNIYAVGCGNYAAYTAALAAETAEIDPILASVDSSISFVSVAKAAHIIKKKNREELMTEFAEDIVSILSSMNAPGCRFLYLTE